MLGNFDTQASEQGLTAQCVGRVAYENVNGGSLSTLPNIAVLVNYDNGSAATTIRSTVLVSAFRSFGEPFDIYMQGSKAHDNSVCKWWANHTNLTLIKFE